MTQHVVVDSRHAAMAAQNGRATAAPLPYASLPRRAAAAIIDALVVLLGTIILVGGPWGFLIIALVGGAIMPHSVVDWIGEAIQGPGPKHWGWTISAQFLAGTLLFLVLGLPLIFSLYGALCEFSRHRATLGKHLFRIVVTDLEGEPIPFRRALKRNLWKVALAVILPINLLVVRFSQREQGLHDALAGTLVLRRARDL
jgi:uncharacterized RDD family membrane protein YckC